MLQLKAELLSNQKIQGEYFCLRLKAPAIAKKALPGEFVQVRISENTNPLLRRPFSIHSSDGSTVEIMYQVVGLATRILAKKQRGEYLDIIGPLGEGFNLSKEGFGEKTHILVAGGMGVAPLFFLAEKLKKGKMIVLLGAKTKNHILCEREFKQLGCAVKVSTDDGSRGFQGRVTALLGHLLSSIDHRLLAIYACGPTPMLKDVSQISCRLNIPAEISLEEHMACGIGACLGCAVNTRDGYQRVCKEGPVFDADEIIW